MKKILIIVLICLFAGTAVLTFFHFFKPRQVHLSESFNAIPVNSCMIIEVNDFDNFFIELSTNKVYKELLKVEGFDKSNSLVHYFYAMSLDNSEISKICNYSSTLISFHILGKDKIEQLIVMPIPTDMSDNNTTQTFTKYFEKKGEINIRQYDNANIHDIQYSDSDKTFSFTVHKGTFIFSKSSLFVESSVRQIESASTKIPDNNDFQEVYRTAGKNEVANIYINKKNFTELIMLLTNENRSRSIRAFEYFGTWSELDLIVGNEILTLNGFSYLSDSIATFLNVLESQSSNPVNSTKILPDGTALYVSLSINNIVRYDQFLSNYLSQIGKEQNRQERLNEIKGSKKADLKETFFPLVNNEVCIAVTNVNILDIFQNAFTIVGVKSRSQAENAISNMLKLVTKNTGESYYDLIEDVSIDESSRIRIYNMPFPGTAELLFGPIFKHCTAEYITFIDDFMVMANSKESLYSLVHNAILNRTMHTSIGHNKFLDNFSNRSNMFVYLSSFAGTDLISSFLSGNAKSILENNKEIFESLGNIGIQLTKSRNMMYNNIVIKHTDEVSERPQTVWESRLETNVDMKPEIVTNHNNNAREIIVQDLNNNLYLLSSSGRELWRISLDEKITSRIYQVDFYKNNRLQYLFSTKNKLHLIDRLGNYVDRYPISLRSESTAPMALFDYHNNRDYRIFIPCEDNRVYLYNLEGNIIAGWSFEYTESSVNREVSYYNHNNHDYIVFNDRHNAYILNRRGEERIKVNTDFEFSKNNKIWHDNNAQDLKFIATDNKGTIRIIDSEGAITSIEIKEFSENHFFMMEDINRNGRNEFVFLDNKTLEVYTQNKQLLFKYDFPSIPEYEPSFYYFPRNQIKIGVVCKSVGKIFLLNQDGTLYSGFPLHGRSLFSIGYLSSGNNRFNLVVGGPENLLYNYEVNEN